MDRVVVSIGGSVLVPGDRDLEYISSLASLLRELSSSCKLFVVTGGGRIARYYIELARELGADETYLDDIGIDVTRLNAKVLIVALGDISYHRPAKSFDEALHASRNYPIVVMGGTHAGHTTDAVAAMLGERVKAHRLVNATSVDGVYTADPKVDKNAKRIERMSHEELLEICGKAHKKAGPNIVFDPLGARLISRSKIPLFVVDGRNFESLKNAILGKDFEGTRVE